MARRLLDLELAAQRLGASRRRYVGIRPITVASIIGTEGRGEDFDAEFSPLKPHVRERMRRVELAFPSADFGPIRVEKLGDAYFVVDGHHRVAIARECSMGAIDAEVTKLTARWHLGAGATAEELLHAEQERLFMIESGLAEVHPDAHVLFTRAVGYRELTETIQVHGYTLMLDAKRPPTRREIADDWFSNVYFPTVRLIAGKKLHGECGNATESDRFLWLWGQRHELSVETGSGQLSEVVDRLTSGGRRPSGRYARRIRLSRATDR